MLPSKHPKSNRAKQTRLDNDPRFARHQIWAMLLTVAWLICVPPATAQLTAEFHQTVAVTLAEPVTLDVEVSSAELEVLYSRDGEVSIKGIARASADAKLDDNFFNAALAIEREGNHLKIRHVSNPAYPEKLINTVYRIDVPYRTEVVSVVGHGKQTFTGIMGPVRAMTGMGDLKASYISKGLHAQVDHGNIDLHVIGDHVDAKTGDGNISCERLAQGVSAETGEGDITLMVVGSSAATVKKGSGRIEAGGVRGSFTGSTSAGDLHIKAIPHDNWRLSSSSGTIRLELPPVAKFELDASTDSGELRVDRDDITRPASGIRHIDQKVNGDGKRIDAHTVTGNITIR